MRPGAASKAAAAAALPEKKLEACRLFTGGGHLVHYLVQRQLIEVDVGVVRHEGHQEALELAALNLAVAADVVDAEGDWRGVRGVGLLDGG